MNKSLLAIIFFLVIGFATLSKLNLAKAQMGNSSYCPTCAMMSNYWNTPFSPSFMNNSNMGINQQSPWWSPYGMYSYNNFYMPSMGWNNYSNHGWYYPGSGQVNMGKPNIYFSVNKDTDVHLKLKFQKNANFLAAVPSHGTSGWNFKVQKEGAILHDGGTYKYAFYDFRLHSDELQDTAGFCVPMENLMEKLTDALTRKGFKENEVRDFSEYWAVKMPTADSYCVYPQENKVVEKVSSYEITPKPSKVERLFFIIVPNHKEYQKVANNGKFSKEPTKSWLAKPSADRATASEPSGLEVREWGVGFLAL